MAIQWYPGHMAKAKKALAEAMPRQDVVVEVLDARAPKASANPVVTELRAHKPCVKVLAKSDLADPEVTRAWLAHFEASSREGKILAMAATTERGGETKQKLLTLCKKLVPRAEGADRTTRRVRVIIVGVPNVGKSTLINTLVGRRVAKVGDEPAVTKTTQEVLLEGGILLTDNPGLMWPKLEDEAASYRLALAGALPDTVLDFENVAHFGAALFLRRYPAALLSRYSLSELPATPEALLVEVGKRRGCIRAGGVVDLHKAADHFIHDFRAGLLGRITLEEP